MTARHVLTILAVGDLARSRAFYRDAFGFKLLVDVAVYAEFEAPGGMRLGLYQREGFARNTGQAPSVTPLGATSATEIYFHVDDMLSAIGKLEAAGARLLSPLAKRDWGDEAAYYADPDGNVLVVAKPLG